MLDLNSFEPDKFDITGNNDPISGNENQNINVNDEEEQKRILARQEEEEKRKEEIAKRRKMLEEREQKKSEENKQEDAWSNFKSNIDLKDSEYKGSKDVQRMREAMMNNPNSQPMQNIFG